jgi:hypothetical protein
VTHSGGKPHETGDRGQRYEVYVFLENDGRRQVIGWWSDRGRADRVAESVCTRPGWVDGAVFDRGENTSPQNRINYSKHFGPLAHVPGYCGKCPGAGRVGDDAVCTVYADDPAPRILDDPSGCNEPPQWCPIRTISERYTADEDRHDHE